MFSNQRLRQDAAGEILQWIQLIESKWDWKFLRNEAIHSLILLSSRELFPPKESSLPSFH
jgi:hypothetical protein